MHYLSVFSEDLVFKEQLYRMFSDSYIIDGLKKDGNCLLPFDLAKIHIRDGFSVQEIAEERVCLLYQWKPNIFLEWSAKVVKNDVQNNPNQNEKKLNWSKSFKFKLFD